MSNTQSWYIVKQSDGCCEIVSANNLDTNKASNAERWGPFESQADAIARRVGLIRSGKCQPR